MFELIDRKQTNLALSADVTESQQLLDLVESCASEICLLKTHIDILNDFTPEITLKLKKLAEKYDFLIFEDRKFSDIGSTVRQQYQQGIYRISDWSDIINAHTLPGRGIIEGLAEIGKPKNRGLLLIAEMSSENNLIDSEYTKKTLQLAEEFPDFVMGFISQRKLNHQPHWIYLTPGISLSNSKDSLKQNYISPHEAINRGTDIIIVGRGIFKAANPLAAAQQYREAGWLAYEKLLSCQNRFPPSQE